MKIVIAIDHFKEGGAERVASVLANFLCAQNDVYTIVVTSGKGYFLDRRIKQRILQGEESSKFLRIPQRLFSFKRALREIQPDAIVAFANYMSIYAVSAFLLSGIKGVRLIVSERTDPTREPNNRIVRLLRNWAYSKADRLVCQTEWVSSYFRTLGMENTVVIPNPLTSSLPKWQGINSTSIITACRIEPQKNLPLLLSAFKIFHTSHPETNLFVYGKGTLVKELKDLCYQLEIDKFVHFEGFSTDIHQIMASSYMYISSSDYEGISNSMLEALGVGMPTVCTDCPVGGAAMFIQGGENGMLTQVGNKNDLANKMDELYSNHELALKCSKNARVSVKWINVENIIDKWLSVIQG